MEMIPLAVRRALTRGTLCDIGKNGSIRRICAADNQIKSYDNASPALRLHKSIGPLGIPLIGPKPNSSGGDFTPISPYARARARAIG